MLVEVLVCWGGVNWKCQHVDLKIWKSDLWSYQLWYLGGVNLQIYPGKSENELWTLLRSLCTGISFLLFDCLKMVLIHHIVKCKVHSVLWQLELGGGQLAVSACRSGNLKIRSVRLSIVIPGGGVNLKIWAHLPFDALLHRRSFCITYERRNNRSLYIWTYLLNNRSLDII